MQPSLALWLCSWSLLVSAVADLIVGVLVHSIDLGSSVDVELTACSPKQSYAGCRKFGRLPSNLDRCLIKGAGPAVSRVVIVLIQL